MWKPFTASSKMSSSIWNRSLGVETFSPKPLPISSTSTSSVPTRTSKTSAPGKSSSNSNRVGLSNSACFHLSSWIITCTTLGDTMSLGTPSQKVAGLRWQVAGKNQNQDKLDRNDGVVLPETRHLAPETCLSVTSVMFLPGLGGTKLQSCPPNQA